MPHPDFRLTEGDAGVTWTVALSDEFGSYDLTGATAVTLVVYDPDQQHPVSTAGGFSKSFTATADPDQVAHKGRASYTFGTGDILAGEWAAKWVIDKPGVHRTFPQRPRMIIVVDAA